MLCKHLSAYRAYIVVKASKRVAISIFWPSHSSRRVACCRVYGLVWDMAVEFECLNQIQGRAGENSKMTLFIPK